jgi:hypothetical protein
LNKKEQVDKAIVEMDILAKATEDMRSSIALCSIDDLKDQADVTKFLSQYLDTHDIQ